MAKIFVSYSRKDLRFVKKLVSDLEEAGLDVWRDLDDLDPGARFSSDIEKALRECQYVIVVLSPDSVASEWVEREYMFADKLENKTIVPVLRRPCELPLFFHNRNYIDVQGRKYKQNFSEILRLLTEGNTLPPPSSPGFPWKVVAGGLVALALAGVFLKPLLFPQPTPTPVPDEVITEETGTKISRTVTDTSKPTESKASPDEIVTEVPPDTPLPEISNEMWVSYDSDVNGNLDIFLLNAFTDEKKEIITDPSHDKVGTWSPDGSILAFESNRGNSLYYQIYLFYSEQEKIIKLTDGVDCSNWSPAWSPDGTKIVFYSNCENDKRNIYMMNRDGSNRKRLTSGSGGNRFPAFSPDGKTITFTSTRSGEDQIFLMDVDGSNQRAIIDGCSSTFSPDGNWLWFSTRCDDSDIKRVGMDGTNLSIFGTILGRNPSVSPDGQFVIFQSNDDIWMMEVDGSNPTQLTSGGSLDGAPSWKP